MGNPIKTKATVSAVASFGTGTYSVRFRPEGAVPRFKAGQFLHLAIGEYDPAGGFWPESRVFSIASAYGAPEIEIVYSVKGRYTRLMEEALRPGREVWLKLPYGDFIVDPSSGRDAVLVAGGTGVSPFLPFLEKLASGQGSAGGRFRLYYGVRLNDMLLARGTLARAARVADIRTQVEDEDPGAAVPEGAAASRGRLDIDRIFAESADLREPAFFLSGPPAMIMAFKERLARAGVTPGRIKIDEWE